LAEHRAVAGAQQAEDNPLALAAGPRGLVAELADARPPGLGRVGLLPDRLSPRGVPVGVVGPVFPLLDSLRQLGVFPLPDGHRLLVVLVGGGVVVVFLALRPRLAQFALVLAVVALALDGERLAAQESAVAVAGQEPVDELPRELRLFVLVDVV